MGRDWHATYLTDARAMAAARERAMRTGDDGWATAYTLALTLPPASGSHDAVGARDILVPQTLPDAGELARLAHATPADPDANHLGGYYEEPNIAVGNLDLSPSMTRRAKPGEVIRPDLKCPACCAADGEPEQSGMQQQTYRCTACHELWNYVPGVDGGEDACGRCWACLLNQQIDFVEGRAERDARAAAIFNFLRGVSVVQMGPDGVAHIAPLPVAAGPPPASEPPWQWHPAVPEEAPESPLVWGAWIDEAVRGAHPVGVSYGTDGRSVRWFRDEVMHVLANPEAVAAREATARTIAELFGIPEHLVRGETDEEYRDRVEVEARQLLTLLHDVSCGLVMASRVDEYPAAPEARQRRLLTTGGAERGIGRRYPRRVQLTALGRITYRALRDSSLTRGRDRHV